MVPIIKKAALIISLLNKGLEPKYIARQVGLKNHRQLAEYMRVKGYIWSVEKRNYIKHQGKYTNHEAIISNSPSPAADIKKDISPLEKYLPLLELLEKNKEQLLNILATTPTTSQLPRHTLLGTAKTKSIYINELLAELVAKFSKTKHITQREIIEGALVEYLKRYGFKQEVESLLR